MYYRDSKQPGNYIKVIGISNDELSNTLRIVFQQSIDGAYCDINEELFDERFDPATKSEFVRQLKQTNGAAVTSPYDRSTADGHYAD